jgi:hypothetical protein
METARNVGQNMDELAYLSGVFDGEGSFGMWSRGVDKSKGFRLSIEMADSDVIMRFLTYFKKGSITVRLPRQEHYKLLYHWRVCDEKGREVIRLMLPYLSRRRQAKFHETT